MRRWFVSLIVFVLSVFLSAQEAENPQKAGRFFAVPISGYANDTSVVFGGILYYTHRPHSRPFSLEPDIYYINSIFSLKKQINLVARSNFYLNGEKHFVAPGVEFVHWPSTFYGIGNNTPSSAAEDYTVNQFNLKSTFINRMNDRFALGFILQYDSYKLSNLEEGGSLASGYIPGSEQFELNKIGFTFQYDTRDFAGYPGTGSFHQLTLMRADKFLNGDYSYNKYVVDFRRYFSPTLNQVFALQGYLSHIDDTAPFQKLGDLGGEIRGYESRRFRDRTFLMMRSEYRLFPWQNHKLLSRLGFVAFAESGQVAAGVKSLRWDETKVSLGSGFRISLLPKEKLNLRIDYGIGKNYADLVITTYEIF